MRLTGGFSMRFPFRQYVPHCIVFSVILAGILTASGCGSGSGNPGDDNGGNNGATPTPSATASASPTPNASPVVVTTRVVWGPRSRQSVQTNAVGGTSSALSGVLTLSPLGSSTPALTINVDRGVLNGPQDYSSAPNTIVPGIYTLNATFYAQANRQGAIVGTAQASATVLGNGTLSTTVATVGRVQSVVLTTGTGAGGLQTVQVGQTVDIGYSALDAAGNVLAVTRGSAFVSVVPNTNTDGTKDTVTRATASAESVTGVTPNRATVVVSVDGVNSAPTQIVVRSSASIVVTPPGASGGTVFVGLGLSQTFNATVTNDGTGSLSGVTWQIVRNGVGDDGQLGGRLSTAGPSLSTTFTATSNSANQTNASNTYFLRVKSVFDPDVFVDVPITIQDGTLPIIVN